MINVVQKSLKLTLKPINPLEKAIASKHKTVEALRIKTLKSLQKIIHKN